MKGVGGMPFRPPPFWVGAVVLAAPPVVALIDAIGMTRDSVGRVGDASTYIGAAWSTGDGASSGGTVSGRCCGTARFWDECDDCAV